MEKQKELSGNQFRKLCRAEFLHYLRVREWQDLHSQVRQVARTLGGSLNSTPADPKAIHQALLTGLLSHVGLKDLEKGEYQGARGARFAVNPGSVLFRRTPRWVMAAELVETTRLWARVCARIEPEWLEPLAGHLVRRNYSEPHWDRARGAVMAYERVTLYGIPIVTRRLVNFGRVDPALARELFIRHALVEGDWETRHAFFDANARALAEVEELEHRARRRDIVVDDEVVFDFYDRRLPPSVTSARHFDAWWKKARRATPDLLTLDRATLVSATAGAVRAEDYPDVWEQDGLSLPLRYRFEPGAPDDGVTVEIPLPVLGRVRAAGFAWQVPGLREELVTALIRALPKPLRREFVPVPDYARAALAAMSPPSGDLVDALELQLRRLAGVPVPHDAWDLARVPDHVRMNFRVLDESGTVVGEGRDLAALQARLAPEVRATLAAVVPDLTREGLRDWPPGALPSSLAQDRAGYRVTAYPALVDQGSSVAVRVFETPSEQASAHAAGVRRLLRLALPAPATVVQGRLTNDAKLALLRSPHGSVPALLDDCADCAVSALVTGDLPWDGDAYRALLARVRPRYAATLLAVLGYVREILDLVPALPGNAPDDLRAQLAGLVHPGFVTTTGWAHLPDVPRYLRAVRRRWERWAENPARDRDQARAVLAVQREYEELLAQAPPGHPARAALDGIRWMIEEFRVAVFAQALGTAYPVSEKRIRKALDELTEG
jgi:ATP-dependent helicase HrpA